MSFLAHHQKQSDYTSLTDESQKMCPKQPSCIRALHILAVSLQVIAAATVYTHRGRRRVVRQPAADSLSRPGAHGCHAMDTSHLTRSPRRRPAVLLAAARRAAVTWWAGQAADLARCDGCCRELRWGEGYLLPARQIPEGWRWGRRTPVNGQADWLVCSSCSRDCLGLALRLRSAIRERRASRGRGASLRRKRGRRDRICPD